MPYQKIPEPFLLEWWKNIKPMNKIIWKLIAQWNGTPEQPTPTPTPTNSHKFTQETLFTDNLIHCGLVATHAITDHGYHRLSGNGSLPNKRPVIIRNKTEIVNSSQQQSSIYLHSYVQIS